MPEPRSVDWRRLRLGLLIATLLLTLAAYAASRVGLQAYLEAPAFRGRLALGDAGDLIVEQVDVAWPPGRLVVARVPRGRGYRLRATLLDSERPELRPLSAVAGSEALVAVNGDYHRLDGFCVATPFSTLIDHGQARTLGSPFGYSAQFWLDARGDPHISRLDLQGRVVRDDGEALAVHYNEELGGALLIDRHPAAWSSGERVGLPLVAAEAPGLFKVIGPPTTRFTGPALLVGPDTPEHAFVLTSPVGSVLRLEQAGADAGRARLVIGTGPHLVKGGVVQEEALAAKKAPGWTARLPRTAVGFDGDHVLLVTTLQAPRCGLSMVDLARVMHALGCQEALNLDGGPSSALWARTGYGGRVVNLPEGVDSEQPVATALVVLPPADGDPGLR